MASLSILSMRRYLRKSLAGRNKNKLRGLLAEVALRNYVVGLGLQDRISPGGWIMRSSRGDSFGKCAFVGFPLTIEADKDYSTTQQLPEPPTVMREVGSVFHSSAIDSFACAATIKKKDRTDSMVWYAKQLGLPTIGDWKPFPDCIGGFVPRPRKFNFLRYNTTTSPIPDSAIPEEFSKECMRIAFQNAFFCEISDVDGVLFGKRMRYSVEVKEKTRANDATVGDYFGLDVGPFVKLAYFAAQKRTLDSLFVVREIDDVETRKHVAWWFVTFEDMAKAASWGARGGGQSMSGGQSAVVRIPLRFFQPLDAKAIEALP